MSQDYQSITGTSDAKVPEEGRTPILEGPPNGYIPNAPALDNTDYIPLYASMMARASSR